MMQKTYEKVLGSKYDIAIINSEKFKEYSNYSAPVFVGPSLKLFNNPFFALSMGVFIDEEFSNLYSENFLRFVIFHELAHITLGHVDDSYIRDEREKARIEGRVSRDELEADAVAAKIIGFENAILALRETAQILEENMERLNLTQEDIFRIHFEMEMRVKNIEWIAD